MKPNRPAVRRPLLHALAVLLLAFAAAAAAAAQDELLQAGDDGGWILQQQAGLVAVEAPDGRAQLLSPPPGTRFTSLVALADGWAAAGSYRDDDGADRLWLQRGDAAGAGELPLPGGRREPRVMGPVLLADGGRLAGLAWLEGADDGSLAVRAAAFEEGRWGAVETVAPPGPGSQLALAGAVLADGSWLLVWSAFDGHDDEIVWSRRVGSSWLPPAPLAADNEVPDLVPAVTAAGGGALAAWSTYDGNDYRLQVARFDGDRWAAPETVGGRGSLYPSFGGGAQRPWLLFLSAADDGWAVARLGAAGDVAQRAVAAGAPRRRPALTTEDGGALTLRWPGRTLRRALRWEVER